MENDIIQWIDNPNRDYVEGLGLLKQCGVPVKMVRMFESRCPRFAMNELVYQLKKRASSCQSSAPKQQNHHLIAINKMMPNTKAINGQSREQEASQQQLKDYSATPAGIAKRMVQNLHTEISKLQNSLFEIGTSNDEVSCARRVDIMAERDPLIKRYNKLYEAKEMFFSGELTEQQLMDIINYKDEVQQPTPSPAADLSDVDLLKKIKAVKACVTRCNNMLQYQSEVAVSNGKKLPENPMPKCPKREKYEAKLAERLQELVAYQCEAQKRGLNGTA